MRKDIPFQEIVPLKTGIAVINAGNWYNNHLEINLLQNGKRVQRRRYDENGICVFNNLVKKGEFEVEIGRTDLKGKIIYKKAKEKVSTGKGGSDYIILVGASVGKAWEFNRLSDRIDIGNIITGSRTLYDFDKSKAIDIICNYSIPIKAVIIKECAAYFPIDNISSTFLIENWVLKLKQKGIVPILATTVPITYAHDKKNSGRFKAIIEFNEFLRKYAYKERIRLLDLEKLLCISLDDRHLKLDYAQEDGLHLNGKAYRDVLDPAVVELLKTIDS